MKIFADEENPVAKWHLTINGDLNIFNKIVSKLLMEKVMAEVSLGRKLQGAKYLKNITGFGLKEAVYTTNVIIKLHITHLEDNLADDAFLYG